MKALKSAHVYAHISHTLTPSVKSSDYWTITSAKLVFFVCIGNCINQFWEKWDVTGLNNVVMGWQRVE